MDQLKINMEIKTKKPRYQWQYVGSSFAILPYKDYDIIDTWENKVIESYNSPLQVKLRLENLNKKI